LPLKAPTRKKQLIITGGCTVALFLTLLVLTSGISRPPSSPPWYDYEIIATYPHDRRALTQGLLYRDRTLYESTGLFGHSSLRQVRLESGEVLQQRSLNHSYFGEGLADWNDTLIQLTWKSEIGIVYDLATFEPLKIFSYSGEGWGLTRFEDSLVMSNGSAELLFLDPVTLKEKRRITVTAAGDLVMGLNELETVEGKIFANVWPTDTIAIIDPNNGKVTGRIDLAGLLPATDRTHYVDVLNGIAYDDDNDRLFVTGKLWPKLFEIILRPRDH
jgi:glutaminyl-peptide cyclotransferase